ncbi:MAG: hypothetical protein ACO200_11965, partial [Steroidobacteraceae bacterium]
MTRRLYWVVEVLVCVLIALSSLALGLWLMPRIGVNYSPWALTQFVGYLAAGPYFWVVGFAAAVLGLRTNPVNSLRIGTSYELLLLGLVWLFISLALMRLGFLWLS